MPATKNGTISGATDTVLLSKIPGDVCALVTVSGTYTGVAFAFSFSKDGSTGTFYPISGARGDGTASETSSGLLSNVSRSWWFVIPAATDFKVAASARATGTANLSIVSTSTPVVPFPTVASSVAQLSGVVGAAPSTNLPANLATRNIFLKADDGNTGVIYVGFASTVTADVGTATSGIPLKAGQAVTLGLNNSNLLWLIGSAAGQNYAGAVI